MCPCHLALLLVVLAGTGVTGTLGPYLALAAVGFTGIFLLLVVRGVKALKAVETGRLHEVL